MDGKCLCVFVRRLRSIVGLLRYLKDLPAAGLSLLGGLCLSGVRLSGADGNLMGSTRALALDPQALNRPRIHTTSRETHLHCKQTY